MNIMKWDFVKLILKKLRFKIILMKPRKGTVTKKYLIVFCCSYYINMNKRKTPEGDGNLTFFSP